MNDKRQKQVIRLTEADLHRIVKESVEKVLNEGVFQQAKQYGQQQGMSNVGATVSAIFNPKQRERGQKYSQSVFTELKNMISKGSSAEAMRQAKTYFQNGTLTKEQLFALQRMVNPGLTQAIV